MSHDLVVCSLEAWDDVWRRNQFLVSGLLDRDPNLRVLFVEPARDPIHDVRSGRRPGTGSGLRQIPSYAGRLHALQPTKWLPRSAGPVADRLLRRSLLAGARRVGMSDPALWVNDPGWAGLVGATGWPALYDITDDWLLADRTGRSHDRTVQNELALLEQCREVVVCSESLLASKGARRPVHLIPNAVDVARFRTPAERPADLPEQRTAVYVGTLHEDRLDVDVVEQTGRELATRDATLVLVGPNALSDTNTHRLVNAPGISVLGPRPNRQIPAYLQHAAVLVVPHVVDAFTGSLDPIKMYEYLAVGRPVVSTRVAGFRDRSEPWVHLADGAKFATTVAQVMAEPSGDVGIVDVPDWSGRVEAMGAVLESVRTSRAD